MDWSAAKQALLSRSSNGIRLMRRFLSSSVTHLFILLFLFPIDILTNNYSSLFGSCLVLIYRLCLTEMDDAVFTLTSSEPLTALDKKEGSPKPEGMPLRR